jgi:uncharacterized RDD family membrane protein YckC
MAPPPKPTPKAGAGDGKQPPPRRPMREPTIPLPAGMRIAEPRSRGMALLFDFAVVLAIYWLVLLVVPGLVNSDYQTKFDNSSHFSKLHDAQVNIDNANKGIASAQKAAANATTSSAQKSAADDLKSAQSDLKSAQKDFNSAKKAVDKQFDGELAAAQKPNGQYDANKLQNTADSLSNDIRGAQYAAYVVVLVLSLLYLVPLTAITGRTLGMRGRKIRVVRADGSPVGWYGAFTRFFIPILVALAIPTLGPVLGLGLVLWGYRDANGQGIHDKLARTLVVTDGR